MQKKLKLRYLIHRVRFSVFFSFFAIDQCILIHDLIIGKCTVVAVYSMVLACVCTLDWQLPESQWGYRVTVCGYAAHTESDSQLNAIHLKYCFIYFIGK